MGFVSFAYNRRGTRFEPEQIMAALNQVPVSACFGGITAEEVVKTMFDLP